MAILNKVKCGSNGGNMGLGKCAVDPALLIGAILPPKGRVLTRDEMVDIRATLQAMAINNTYANRAFITVPFEEIDDQSEDRSEKTYGYGRKVTVRDAVYTWGFTFIEGGFCGFRSMLQFKNRQSEFDVIFIDSNFTLWGTTGIDADGNEALKGATLTQIYVDNWKPANGSDPATYMVEFSLANASELNEYAAFVTLDFNPLTDIDQVQDVRIATIDTNVIDEDGIINLGLYSGCGGNNLVSTYGATAVNVTRYTAVNTATGGTITITSVTQAGTSQDPYIIFNLDETDVDYPASGGYVTINTTGVAAWATAGMSYFEAQPITLQVA